MITREAFAILAIVLGSVSTLHYPTNQSCICTPSVNRVGIEINCTTKNDSSFFVDIQHGHYIKIECINSPEWSDFHWDVSSLPRLKTIQRVFFSGCDLPTNNSLGEITQTLGITGVEELIFQSFKNLSFALVKHHLDDFENLKSLSLTSNNVSYADKDLLAGLVNLTQLNLRDNNLHQVSGFFNYTPGLQLLELGDNALQSIEPGTFDNLKNLTFLNLWKNHLTEPRSGIFDELIALKSLDLNMNYMVKLPEDIFAKLENLEVLNLSRNNFTNLKRNLLRNNTKLRTFTLFDNKRNMTTLPDAFFANLTKLEALKLKRNGFVRLPEDLFWGCTSLINITLERNYLRTLPRYIFRDLKELKILELNFNDLENLPDYIFMNTEHLVKLDLSKNRITSISNDLFSGLRALEELNIQENQLMTISNQGFRSLIHLRIANLSYNNLTLQRNSTIDKYKSPFHDCLALEELYLANNSISEIFSDWIVSDVRLRKLDLKYNNISYIQATDMEFISNDIKVDLTHNKIKHIFLRDAEFTVIDTLSSHDAIILVDDNPLECDCRLYDFLRYIEGRMHPKVQNYFHIIPGNLTCQSPDELKNVRVTDLKSETFTCVIKEPKVCPEKCDCFVRPKDRAFIFDCSHKNLTSVPSDMKKPVNGSFQFELNFSGNRFTRMPDLKAMGFESVRKLILSHNAISEIPLDRLSNTMQVLELHNNNLSRIDPAVLEFLKQSTNLTGLTLHENPWECDCEAKDFLSFIQTKFVNMTDLLKVTCSGRNISVSEMTVVDFCPLYTTTIIVICIVISLAGFLIGIFGLLYYKYQQEIKVWLFAHHWCLWFVTEEELDKEKLYDAFVSYSHKDEDFVVDKLVTELENGPTPFKLCLHYRHFIPGEWIQANIASSVENSRRTIVVLSPNFLKSEWGKMEFRAAHSQALSEGRARVILILYGDIGPTDDLDPELKAYLSMNTYVKWGDPWFWDKLRYALPHQPKLARNSIAGKKIFENHQPCIQANGEKELIYPIGLPETPPITTPPADALKKFTCDKESEAQLFSNVYPRESCKSNGNIAIILSPEHLIKRDNEECLV